MNRIRLFFVTIVLVASPSWISCVTSLGGGNSADREPKPPLIKEGMPPQEAVDAAIQFGGDILEQVKRLGKKAAYGKEMGKVAESVLKSSSSSLGDRQLLNGGHLYASMPIAFDAYLFKQMIRSSRILERQLGWQLAASKPSPTVASVMDAEFTRVVSENELEQVLIPTMANAVAVNRLKTAYTMVRQGLFVRGDEEFAQAMMVLQPEKASEDFMLYLSQAPVEELRQLTLSSVNLYTAVAILKHFQKFPPNLANAHFDHLFLYAVSRNTGLAELAQNALESYVPNHTDILAMALAKHPAWVQIAYLENARRRMNPKEGLLLNELKKVTSERDVIEEIDEAKL